MKRLIATIPINGHPDAQRLNDIVMTATMEGWEEVVAIAHAVGDGYDRWEVLVFGGGRTDRTEPRCTGCGGALIGSEVKYGTCGHCGGRSLTPEPVPTQHARLTVREGLIAIAGGWCIGFALAIGVLLIAALGAATSWLADQIGGWPQLMFAIAGVGAVAGIVWAVVDPEAVRP